MEYNHKCFKVAIAVFEIQVLHPNGNLATWACDPNVTSRFKGMGKLTL